MLTATGSDTMLHCSYLVQGLAPLGVAGASSVNTGAQDCEVSGKDYQAAYCVSNTFTLIFF